MNNQAILIPLGNCFCMTVPVPRARYIGDLIAEPAEGTTTPSRIGDIVSSPLSNVFPNGNLLARIFHELAVPAALNRCGAARVAG